MLSVKFLTLRMPSESTDGIIVTIDVPGVDNQLYANEALYVSLLYLTGLTDLA